MYLDEYYSEILINVDVEELEEAAESLAGEEWL